MKIGILGCGNMGSSIATSLVRANELFVFDRYPAAMNSLADTLKIHACDSVPELVRHVDMVILAVKPKDLNNVAEDVKKYLLPSQVIVSMLSGTPVSLLQTLFKGAQVVRMMPNLAVRYGKGVIGIADNAGISEKVRQVINEIFAPLGTLIWIQEQMMDALTSLTGSGPAFSLLLIESMIEAGIAMGFSASQAKELVIQMLSGTLEMLKATGEHPAELKLQVTSPAGTTVAGLMKLEQHAVRYGVQQAFMAAFERSHAIESLSQGCKS